MLERLWRRATRSVLLWDIGLTLAGAMAGGARAQPAAARRGA